MVRWLSKWYNYLFKGACPKCSRRLTEREEKVLDYRGEVEHTKPIQWCAYCGHKIYQMKFWFP